MFWVNLLSLQQHQSVLMDVFGPPAVPATSSHGWDSNLVSAVSRLLHQPPGTLYRHHCNNSLTLTHLNGSWKLFFSNKPFLRLLSVFIFFIQSTLFHIYCRAMLCINAAYAVMRCLSVCLSVRPSVTFVDHVKTNKDIFKIFSHSGSHTILVFLCHIPTGTPLTGASNACGVGRNRDSDPISGFNACS